MTITMPIKASFDVETKSMGDDPYVLEVTSLSVIGSDEPWKLNLWDQDHIDDGIEYMLTFPGLVSFNGRKFDIPTLLKYIERPLGGKLRSLPHYDIYDEFLRIYSRRISLSNMAKYTLNIDKWDLQTMSASAMWRLDPEKLFKYNAWDTYLTYLLYTHTVSFGSLFFKMPTLQRFVPQTISRPGGL